MCIKWKNVKFSAALQMQEKKVQTIRLGENLKGAKNEMMGVRKIKDPKKGGTKMKENKVR